MIRAVEGQLIEVHLRNESVAAGITLHWHGVDVPNADDGVAGVTQDAVMIGQSFTYRFVADHAGTYWYHSHQTSNEQVSGGLLGTAGDRAPWCRRAADDAGHRACPHIRWHADDQRSADRTCGCRRNPARPYASG